MILSFVRNRQELKNNVDLIFQEYRKYLLSDEYAKGSNQGWVTWFKSLPAVKRYYLCIYDALISEENAKKIGGGKI